jgi:hypothetical protein
MTSKTSETMCAISAAAATAIFMMAGVARADDGGDGGDGGELLPIVYVGGDEAPAPANCAEQRERARFEVEMKRTDGDVWPTAATINCRDEIYAQTTVDAD